MQKLQVFFSITLLILIIGIVIVSQTSQKMSTNVSITPTIDMSQPFQLIQPSQQVQSAQTQQTQQPQTNNNLPTPTAEVTQPPPPASVSAIIKTSKGDIDITLYGSEAPNTVNNFITKANSNFYNNLTFHRVEDWVVQGGDPNGDGTGGGQMPAEQTSKPFVTGSIGIARGSDPKINNASQFFITKSDASWLNGQYTNFGMVTSGMDVVNKLQIGDKILGITINLTQTEGGLTESP
ncbi:MAG TPA: peptidylprolyl isomerase [Patescibacteria group bacterium]|nr:peptidylprolyl isomerase [Patescibacteria group bacterium]